MKHRILLLVAFFFVSHYAYSQRVANAMPLDIPLNSTKESAVQKLLRYNYNLWDSYEQEGFKVLEYKREYNKKKVRLWLKNNIVSIVSWTLDYDESCMVLAELKDVYDFKPYAQIDEPDTFRDEQSYFYWKGNTIIVGCYELFILSNADAAKRYQKENQEIERREQERIEKERLEQEKKERERKEAEKRQREAHIKELKSNYSPCRFLFATESSFVSCITQDNSNAVENEIKALIDQKMVEISNVIVKGTEFKDNYDAWSNMEKICNISMRTVSIPIANYAENKMENFVTSRAKLNKAYDKAKTKHLTLKYSDFLISYISDNREKIEKKFEIENAHGMVFLMPNAAYSFAPQTSFGLTTGVVVKDVGVYVSLNSDSGFKLIKSDIFDIIAPDNEYECDYSGTISDLNSEYSYSGNKRTSHFGATAGVVYRISNPLYCYTGIGYGLRNVYWELDNGKWARCIDDSSKGVALDAGLMYNIGNFSLSLGVQTIGVKYMEAKIGVGINLKFDDQYNLQ